MGAKKEVALDSTSYVHRGDPGQFSLELPATRTDAVYAMLKDQIVSQALPPGTRLIIRRIAREAGVSAIPVREALRRIESDGLVRNVPHVGMTVTGANHVEMANDYRILAVLSGLAARLAVPCLTERDIDEMARHVEAIDLCIREDRLGEAHPHNIGFHEIVHAACGVPRLRTMITDLWLHNIHRNRLGLIFGHYPPGRAVTANQEHRAILDALRVRDADLSERLMREHFWLSAELRRRYFAERPSDPETSVVGIGAT